MSDQLEDRVSDLEDQIDFLKQNTENWREQVFNRKLDELRAERDDAQDERVGLRTELSAVKEELASVKAELEAAVGVEESDASNPQKRAKDVRQALIREARDRTDATGGVSHSMWWREIQQFFSRTGHGHITKPDCYKAMRWAAGEGENVPERFTPGDGFEMAQKANADGRDVKAVKVVLDDLPGEIVGETDASRNPTTSETGGSPQNNGVSANEASSD